VVIRTDLSDYSAALRHVGRYMRIENGAEYDLMSLARAPRHEAYKDIRTRTENKRVEKQVATSVRLAKQRSTRLGRSDKHQVRIEENEKKQTKPHAAACLQTAGDT